MSKFNNKSILKPEKKINTFGHFLKESLEYRVYNLLKLINESDFLSEYQGYLLLLKLNIGKIVELQIDENIADYYIWDSMDLFEASVDMDKEELEISNVDEKNKEKLEHLIGEEIETIYETLL